MHCIRNTIPYVQIENYANSLDLSMSIDSICQNLDIVLASGDGNCIANALVICIIDLITKNRLTISDSDIDNYTDGSLLRKLIAGYYKKCIDKKCDAIFKRDIGIDLESNNAAILNNMKADGRDIDEASNHFLLIVSFVLKIKINVIQYTSNRKTNGDVEFYKSAAVYCANKHLTTHNLPEANLICIENRHFNAGISVTNNIRDAKYLEYMRNYQKRLEGGSSTMMNMTKCIKEDSIRALQVEKDKEYARKILQEERDREYAQRLQKSLM